MPFSKAAIAATALGVTGVVVALRKPKKKRPRRFVSMAGFVLPKQSPDPPTTTGGTPPPPIWPWHTKTFPYIGEFTSVDRDTPVSDLPIPNAPPLPGPIATAYNAIANHIGETLLNLVRSLSGMHGTVKTPGRWYVIATRPGTQALADVVVQWGRKKNGKRRFPCAEMRFSGERASSGPLPLDEFVELPGPGTPKPTDPDPADIVDYCRGQSPNFVSKWIEPNPPGKNVPDVEIASEGGTLALLLWVPARGGEYWYDVAYRWKKTG